MWGIIIALISGALMSIQGVFNTEVTKATSMWISNSWVQFTALLVCLAAWAFTDRGNLLGVFQIEHKYMLLGVEKAAFEWKKLLGMALSIAGIILFKK